MLNWSHKLSISELSMNMKAVLVQNSQDWIKVQAIDRALEVCAAALQRYSKQFANNPHRQTSGYQ